LPATINALIAVAVNQLTVSGVGVSVTINPLSLDAMLIYYYLYAAFSPLPSTTQHNTHLQWIKELRCSNGIWIRLIVLSKTRNATPHAINWCVLLMLITILMGGWVVPSWLQNKVAVCVWFPTKKNPC
jgi:hypothetical protein